MELWIIKTSQEKMNKILIGRWIRQILYDSDRIQPVTESSTNANKKLQDAT